MWVNEKFWTCVQILLHGYNAFICLFLWFITWSCILNPWLSRTSIKFSGNNIPDKSSVLYFSRSHDPHNWFASLSLVAPDGQSKMVAQKYEILFFFVFLCIPFTLFRTKNYSHQVLIYLEVPGISVRKSLQNRQIGNWRTTGCLSLGVICASLLTWRHLLMNKKDKNSRYTNMKIMII